MVVGLFREKEGGEQASHLQSCEKFNAMLQDAILIGEIG